MFFFVFLAFSIFIIIIINHRHHLRLFFLSFRLSLLPSSLPSPVTLSPLFFSYPIFLLPSPFSFPLLVLLPLHPCKLFPTVTSLTLSRRRISILKAFSRNHSQSFYFFLLLPVIRLRIPPLPALFTPPPFIRLVKVALEFYYSHSKLFLTHRVT